MLADVLKVAVKGQHRAVVFLCQYGNIAIRQVYVFPFSLQLIGQPSCFEPSLVRLIDNGEGVHEFPDDRDLLLGFRSLHQFRHDDPRNAYFPVLRDLLHKADKPRRLVPEEFDPDRRIDQNPLSAHSVVFHPP